MTAVLCHMAKDKGGPEIKFQLLLWPVTDADFTRESWQKYGEGRFLTAPLMKWMWDNYLPDLEKRRVLRNTFQCFFRAVKRIATSISTIGRE
jgi:acetyl esterase/lipase